MLKEKLVTLRGIFVLWVMFISVPGLSQTTFQGSIRQGASANSVDILLLPNQTSTSNEYINYLSISIAIPTVSASGVNPSISSPSPYSFTFVPAATYTYGTDKIYTWIFAKAPQSPMTWVAGNHFVGATISFDGGGAASSMIKLVDITDEAGGSNGNTFFGVGVNIPPFDLTDYSNFFYSIPDPNGSTLGSYPSGDHYVQTSLSIPLSSSCPQPSAPSIGTVDQNNAQINWTGPSGATYEYLLAASSSLPITGGTSTISNSFDTTNLTPGTTYYFFIRTICGAGSVSNWMPYLEVQTTCPPPPMPAVSEITPSGATVSWTENEYALLGYDYVVNTSPADPDPSTALHTLNDTVTITNLTEGTDYYVHVRSSCSPGNNSTWVSVPFRTTFPPCNSPVLLSTLVAGDSARVTWNNVVGAVSYEYAISTSFGTPTVFLPTTDTSFLASNLTSNTVYYVYVRSVCGPDRSSNPSNNSFTSSCLRPSPFVIGISTEIGTADLGWNKVDNVVKYEYSILEFKVPPPGSMNFTIDTSFHALGLKPDGKYYLHVRAHCGPTNITEWSTLEFNTSGLQVYPNPVSGIAAVKIYGHGSSELSLLNSSGQLLKKIKLVNNTAQLDMGQYASGLYFIRYNTDKVNIVRLLKL